MRMRSKSVALPVLVAVASATVVGLASPSSAAVADVRVNAGGGALTDAGGRAWAADRGFVGGWVHSTSERVTGTLDSARFQTERAGMSGYQLPLAAAGNYRVSLDFAEIYHTAAGQRVFSVAAEGTEIVRDLDIWALVGKNKALTLTADVPVTDGRLDLTFTASKDSAKVSAISVTPIGAASTAPAPTTTTAPAPTASTPVPACTVTMPAGGNVASFINGLAAGAVGCLPGGTYSGANIEVSKSGAAGRPITVQSVPGQTAKLATALRVSGDFLTFRGLLFDTDHKLSTSNVWVKSTANDVTFEANEFADSGLAGTVAHDGQCLYSDYGSANVKIVRNYFHDCGSMEHFHHSMYLNGTGYTIADNLVLRTKAWGIHLYPNMDNSLIANNTVDGSGRAGIILTEDSINNRVVNNILSNNAQGGIDGYAPIGTNYVHDNLCFNNGGFCVEAGNKFSGGNNTEGDPRYTNRAGGDFRLNTGSPAIGTANASYANRPDKNGITRPQGGAADTGAYER